MGKIKKRRIFLREAVVWTACLAVSFFAVWFVFPQFKSVLADVGTANAGTLVYGDTTNAGTVKFRGLTYSDTFSAEMAGPAASASRIAHVVAKNSPLRNEVITGQLKVDGRLDVHQCVGGCDLASEMTSLFNKTGISLTLSCDTTPGTCNRPFDIAYEALSGTAMVAFSGDSGILSFCRWNGSALSPVNCTTPDTFSLSAANCGTAAGVIEYLSLSPRGGNLKGVRSNEIIAVFTTSSPQTFALIWDGSQWGNCTLIQPTAKVGQLSAAGEWENTTGNAMVVYSNSFSASTTPFSYKRWIRSSGTWDSSGTTLPAQSASRIGHWVDLAGASQEGKNHIAIMTTAATTSGGTTGAGVPYIWDGSTMTKGNEWADIESTLNDSSAVAIEALNTNVQALYVSSGGAASDDTSYETWIEGTGFFAVTDVLGAMADDAESHQLMSSPNRNDIYLQGSSIDDSLEVQRWSGSAWNADFNSALETTLSPGAVTTNAHGPEKGSYMLSLRPYSPWQRNWRFYSTASEASCSNNPCSSPTSSVALANENIAPTGVDPGNGAFRLRMNYAERGGLDSIDARKKLQYTSNCTPNTAGGESGCTWTDVDDPAGAGIWRYKDLTCSTTDCADGVLLTSTVLTGSSGSCVTGGGCGTWVMDKDAAASVSMDHGALTTQESEWQVEANSAAAGTTYYFRIYDNDQLTPQFREQDANDCGAGSSTCTYPSLTTTVRTFEQSAYRLFQNQDSTSVSTALAAQDTPATLAAAGDAFRLRALLHTGGVGLPAPAWVSSAAEASANDVGFRSSIAAVDANTIYISHYDGTAGDLRFCKSINAGSSFTCLAAEASANDVGLYSSIAAVDANTIYISHYDGTAGDLRFCKSTNAGGNWTCSAAEASANDVGQSSSIAAVDANTIYISHFDNTAGDLRFCKSINAGSSFTCSAAEASANQVGLYSSIAAVDANTIYISHNDGTANDLRFCKSTNAGGNWTCSAAEASADFLGYYSSIAAVDANTIYISHYSNSAGDLRFCKSTNAGSSFTCLAAEATIDAGWYSSIAAVDANTIYISHYDNNAGDLRFCKSINAGSSFTCLAAEASANLVGQYSSIAAVNADTIYISHFDGTAADLRLSKLLPPTQSFKLQYAVKSGTCDTAFSGETYADVPQSTAAAVHFNNNSTPTDDSNLMANGTLDPTHGADTVVAQTYEEANNFTNTTATIPADQDGKWDFALKTSTSASGSYCLRAVKSDGSTLNTYTVIPEIGIASGPTVDQLMRHGNFFSAGAEQYFSWAD